MERWIMALPIVAGALLVATFFRLPVTGWPAEIIGWLTWAATTYAWYVMYRDSRNSDLSVWKYMAVLVVYRLIDILTLILAIVGFDTESVNTDSALVIILGFVAVLFGIAFLLVFLGTPGKWRECGVESLHKVFKQYIIIMIVTVVIAVILGIVKQKELSEMLTQTVPAFFAVVFFRHRGDVALRAEQPNQAA